jgi:glutamate dehydrogenase (NAD(P)+)
MGTNNKELDEAAAAVGLARRGRRYRGWGERSGLYTGFSVVGAALQALDHLKMPVATSRVAIEGFGKVGTSVAQLFSDCGARIVALSTRYGALYSAQGLNVSELMRLYQKFGSSVVKAYGQAERITIGELLELDVEVLSPCARYHSITSENASKVGASIISAGANNPVTPEAEQILFARGKLCLPDFATNCGGMLGEALEFAGFKEAYIRDFIIAKTRAKTSAMLKPLEKANGPLREHWEPIVLEKFFAVKARAERPSLRGSLYRAARTLYRHGFVPGFLVRHWARRYFDRLLVAP